MKQIKNGKLGSSILMYAFTFLSSMTLFACNNNKNNIDSISNNMYIDSLGVKNTLSSQLKNGTSSEYGDRSALNSLFRVSDTMLLHNGYKKKSKKEMLDKIKDVFGFYPLNVDPLISYIQICNEPAKEDNGALMDIINKDIIDYKSSVFSPIYISYEYNLITFAYYLPEIIDYQSIAPELQEMEAKEAYLEEVDEFGEQQKYKIEFWKDIPNLTKQQEYNRNFLIHLNKYVFNDSKASLMWLKNNYPDFLEMLVVHYGYMKDKDLLKWIFDRRSILKFNDKNMSSNLFNFGQLIARRNCDGKISFNEKILESLGDTPEDSYMQQISLFLQFLITDYKDLNFVERGYEKLSFEERAEILARLLYWAESLSRRNRNISVNEKPFTYSLYINKYTRIFYEKNNLYDRYEAEFKRKNYYNLPQFQEYLEEAKQREEYIRPVVDPEDSSY